MLDALETILPKRMESPLSLISLSPSSLSIPPYVNDSISFLTDMCNSKAIIFNPHALKVLTHISVGWGKHQPKSLNNGCHGHLNMIIVLLRGRGAHCLGWLWDHFSFLDAISLGLAPWLSLKGK